MIPYAVLMMKFLWKNENLEVRAMDPLTDGVSFRLSSERKDVSVYPPEKIEFCFLDPAEKTYGKYLLTEILIERKTDDETEKLNAVFYELHTTDPVFLKKYLRLMAQYENYIRLKTQCDDLEVMEKMTETRMSRTYPQTVAEWHENMRKTSRQTGGNWDPAPCEIAVCLDGPSMWKSYLEMGLPEFLEYYWKENGLAGHPVTKRKVTHLYVGSGCCHFLFPDEELEKIYDRAVSDGLEPVTVFSVMPEHLVRIFSERIGRVLAWYRKAGKIPEIVVSDTGTAELIGSLADKSAPAARPVLRAGTMLCRRRKDPRWEKFQEPSGSSADSEIIRNYYRERFGITLWSYEACGYPIETAPGSALHLPLYQMNTSGYCTMYALCRNGDRENQEQNLSCPHYCEDRFVFYPENMKIIGRWNGIYGCSRTELDNAGLLNEMLENGVSRLVVRA